MSLLSFWLLPGCVAENSAATRSGLMFSISRPLLGASARAESVGVRADSNQPSGGAQRNQNGEGLIELLDHVEGLPGEWVMPHGLETQRGK